MARTMESPCQSTSLSSIVLLTKEDPIIHQSIPPPHPPFPPLKSLPNALTLQRSNPPIRPPIQRFNSLTIQRSLSASPAFPPPNTTAPAARKPESSICAFQPSTPKSPNSAPNLTS